VQIGSHVLNACTHVFKALDVRVIMGLQYVRTDNAFNACKTCGHAATVQLQCSTSLAGHTQGITTMPSDATGPSQAVDRARCDRATHALSKPSLAIPSHKSPNCSNRFPTTPVPPVGPWGIM
jgi:hypothetical protein